MSIVNYTFRDGKFLFKVKGQSHKIGSKMFPVKSPNKIRVFTHENTQPIENSALAQAIDGLTYEMGRCYTNSDRIVGLKDSLQLPLEFYAGWLFVGDGFPILHSWVVLGDNVLDMSLSLMDTEAMSLLEDKHLPPEQLRYVMTEMLAHNRKKNLPRSEDGVFGQVFPDFVYVGCPDEKERAAVSFFDIIKKFPHHPVPSLHNFDAQGMSPMQKRVSQKMRQ